MFYIDQLNVWTPEPIADWSICCDNNSNNANSNFFWHECSRVRVQLVYMFTCLKFKGAPPAIRQVAQLCELSYSYLLSLCVPWIFMWYCGVIVIVCVLWIFMWYCGVIVTVCVSLIFMWYFDVIVTVCVSLMFMWSHINLLCQTLSQICMKPPSSITVYLAIYKSVVTFLYFVCVIVNVLVIYQVIFNCSILLMCICNEHPFYSNVRQWMQTLITFSHLLLTQLLL